MWSEPGGLRKARQPVGGFSGWPGLFAQPPSQYMTKPQNSVLRSQVLDVEFLYGPTAPTSETAMAQDDRVIPRAKGCGVGEVGFRGGNKQYGKRYSPFTSEGGPIPLSEVTHALHLTLISASEPSWRDNRQLPLADRELWVGRPRSLSFPLGAWLRDKNCVGSSAHSPFGLGKGCPPTQGMRHWVWPLPGTTLPRPFRMRFGFLTALA